MARAATIRAFLRQQRGLALFVIETFSNAPTWPFEYFSPINKFRPWYQRMWEPINPSEGETRSLVKLQTCRILLILRFVYNFLRYSWNFLSGERNEDSNIHRRIIIQKRGDEGFSINRFRYFSYSPISIIFPSLFSQNFHEILRRKDDDKAKESIQFWRLFHTGRLRKAWIRKWNSFLHRAEETFSSKESILRIGARPKLGASNVSQPEWKKGKDGSVTKRVPDKRVPNARARRRRIQHNDPPSLSRFDHLSFTGEISSFFPSQTL